MSRHITTSLVFAAFLLASCASSVSQQTNSQTAPAQGATISSQTTQALQGFNAIDTSLSLTRADLQTPATLGQILSSQNKTVGIFQFSALGCESCEEHARTLEAAIAASPYASKMAHIVVFTDNPQGVNDAEQRWEQYMQEFAPTGVRAHDLNETLFKRFSVTPEHRILGLTVVVGANQLGKVFYAEQFDQALPAAQQLAQAQN